MTALELRKNRQGFLQTEKTVSLSASSPIVTIKASANECFELQSKDIRLSVRSESGVYCPTQTHDNQCLVHEGTILIESIVPIYSNQVIQVTFQHYEFL